MRVGVVVVKKGEGAVDGGIDVDGVFLNLQVVRDGLLEFFVAGRLEGRGAIVSEELAAND